MDRSCASTAAAAVCEGPRVIRPGAHVIIILDAPASVIAGKTLGSEVDPQLTAL